MPGINTGFFLLGLIRPAVLVFLMLAFPVRILAQEIRIDADALPLNQVLINLAREQQVQLSFDDQYLSSFVVDMHQSFPSAEVALSALIHNFPLEMERIGAVYTLYPKKTLPKKISYTLRGQVRDASNGEALPFTHVQANKLGMISDVQGNFSFFSKKDSLFTVKASYLGYFVLDTVLKAGIRHKISLAPSLIGLEEVTIEGSTTERSGQAGEEAGVLRLNHKIAKRLSGNGDNSIFNFLRLQPGVLAAGERSADMIIWGSYSGHSQILFDGITIFGMKNFNDNLSFVNPYMSKDIKVMKGGFGADYGNRVGGIVEITGTEGNTSKPAINLNINNMTVNGMGSVPVGKRSALSLAFRNTYYQLYDEEDFNISKATGKGNSKKVDISILPDYLFRDFNLKYAGSTKKGDSYYLSLYQGKDHFSYSVDKERNRSRIQQEVEEKNRQRGGSLFYNKSWKKGISSQFNLSYSGLDRDYYEKQTVSSTGNNFTASDHESIIYNQVQEVLLKNQNLQALSEKHHLQWGWETHWNGTAFSEDSLDQELASVENEGYRISLFAMDHWRPFPGLLLTPGIRLEAPTGLGRLYPEPRISASLDLGRNWKVNAAWGIYHQFIAETALVDELGNFRYLWALCDNMEMRVPEARHLVGGLTYRNYGTLVSLEGFWKNTTNISRVRYRPITGDTRTFFGEARVRGMDLLVKQYFRKHEAWVSYTLSKIEETFPYIPDDLYLVAPQDQRHEVKGAMLLNFKPLFFSANYVYGSGFPEKPIRIDSEPERFPYSRLDLALIYRYSVKHYHFEAGISILNVMNTENIKLSDRVRIPDAQSGSVSIQAQAVPFTPTLYLNLVF